MARGKFPSAASLIQKGLQADEARIRSLFAKAKKLYAPEGEFMAGTEAAISRGSKRAVASGVQQLASAGLAGTSIVGGLGKKYEEEIGMPARERATSARLGALAGLLQAEAGAELQLSMRPPITIGGGYGGGGGGGRRTTAPRTTAQPRTAVQPRTTAVQPQQRPSLPTLNFPKKLAPAGQWQATIGGTSYYSTGTGGYTQKQAPAPPGHAASAPRKRPLSNYYDVGGELGI